MTAVCRSRARSYLLTKGLEQDFLQPLTRVQWTNSLPTSSFYLYTVDVMLQKIDQIFFSFKKGLTKVLF